MLMTKTFMGGFFGSFAGFVLLFVAAYFIGSSYPQYGIEAKQKLGLK